MKFSQPFLIGDSRMFNQKSFKGNHGTGTLYLVPTPIGNLEDMSVIGVCVCCKKRI